MATEPPKYPISDEEVAEFVSHMHCWRKRLHLMDWRISRGRSRPHGNLADVTVYPEHRLAKFNVGRDWGTEPPAAGDLERVAIHELLHLRLHEMAKALESDTELTEEEVNAAEHAAVIPLTEAFFDLAQELAQAKKRIAELEAKNGSGKVQEAL